MLVIGLALIAFGVSDLVMSRAIERRAGSAPGRDFMGERPTPPAVKILRWSGVAFVAAGAVVAAIGLAT